MLPEQLLCNIDNKVTFALIVISEDILDAIILGEMSSPSQFIMMYQLYTYQSVGIYAGSKKG